MVILSEHTGVFKKKVSWPIWRRTIVNMQISNAPVSRTLEETVVTLQESVGSARPVGSTWTLRWAQVKSDSMWKQRRKSFKKSHSARFHVYPGIGGNRKDFRAEETCLRPFHPFL